MSARPRGDATFLRVGGQCQDVEPGCRRSWAAPVDAGRRLTGVAELPVTAAVVLALLASDPGDWWSGEQWAGEEPVFGQPGVVSDGPPTIALLLALLATVPMAMVRTHLLVAAATVTLANTAMLAGGYVPTVAATIALVVVSYLVARHRAHRVWLLLLLPLALLLVFPLGAAGDSEGDIALILTLTAVAGIVGSTGRSRAEAAATTSVGGVAGREPARARGAGGAGPDSPRAARRGRPPHFDDLRSGGPPPG